MPQLIIKDDTNELQWVSDFWKSEIKRIFYLYNVPEKKARGYHRHRFCRMAMVCLTGTVEVYVQSSPEKDFFYHLNSPHQVLLLDPTDWRVMYNFSEKAVLMVLADRHYDDTFYIDEPYRPITNDFLLRDN